MAGSMCHRLEACVEHVSTSRSMCQACVKHVSSMCHAPEACVFVSKSLILLILLGHGPSCRFAPRRGRAGRPGRCPHAGTLCFSTGPCVFRPDPVFFDRTLCFSGGACVSGPVFFGAEAGVSGAEQVSTGMCQTGGACVFGMCHGEGACANGHVPTGRSMCLGLQVLDFIASTGCGAIAGSRSGGAGRSVPGRCRRVRALCFSTGPCVFRPDPVFLGRSLCLWPCVFRGGSRCLWRGACVFGRCHDAGAGVNGMCQTGGACVLGMCHGAGACANGHVPTGMCQRACANGHVPMRRAGVNGQVLSAGVVGLERGPAQSAAARAGAAKRRPSSRSSRPPWPGISRPLSFLPEARFQ